MKLRTDDPAVFDRQLRWLVSKPLPLFLRLTDEIAGLMWPFYSTKSSNNVFVPSTKSRSEGGCFTTLSEKNKSRVYQWAEKCSFSAVIIARNDMARALGCYHWNSSRRRRRRQVTSCNAPSTKLLLQALEAGENRKSLLYSAFYKRSSASHSRPHRHPHELGHRRVLLDYLLIPLFLIHFNVISEAFSWLLPKFVMHIEGYISVHTSASSGPPNGSAHSTNPTSKISANLLKWHEFKLGLKSLRRRCSFFVAHKTLFQSALYRNCYCWHCLFFHLRRSLNRLRQLRWKLKACVKSLDAFI